MSDIYDVAIVGSGPAGLTAGLYTSRAGLNTILFAGAKWGGQLMLTTEVENYPGFPEGIMGPELMEKVRKQAERFGTKIVDENVHEIDFSKRPFTLGGIQAKSVIVATGARTKWLDLPNEQKLIGRGVSSCAPCDAPFFKNKRVVVIGGGDSAAEEALVLTKFASEVNIVLRRDIFRASQIMQDRLLANPKVKITKNAEVIDVLGEEKVTGLKFRNTSTQEEFVMETDGLFVAIGHIPDCDLFKKYINTDDSGYIVRTPTDRYKSATSLRGVFTAGDVHDNHYRQAVTAAGYGCEAALEAERWLTENE